MRMQYKVCAATSFKYYILVYHDGELFDAYKLWSDELNEKVDELESQGYVRGFSKQEVEKERIRYEMMLENII